MIKNVIQFGNPLLSTKAESVSDHKAAEVRAAIRDLTDTMFATLALGLAAPHIGILKRIIIIDTDASDSHIQIQKKCKPMVLLNPTLTWASETVESAWEGSVSVPGIRGWVSRSTHIKVHYMDPATGSLKTAEFRGFLARIWQHERDQLDGILFLDKASKQESING